MNDGSRHVLAALADELERTRAGVDSLANLVSHYVRDGSPARQAEAIREAQAVDGLSQQLEALAAFARALAAGKTVPEAADAVLLNDLAERLAAAVSGEAKAAPAQSAGDLELFD